MNCNNQGDIMAETHGIIMFNCGTEMIIRAIVALYSLRKHYSGPITFYVEDPCLPEFEKVLTDFGCNVIHLPESKEDVFIKKNYLFNNPPYDKNLWLDLDIVVVDKIDEMFNALSEVDVCIPHFWNKYTTQGKENLCSGRIKKFQGHIENDFIQEALNNHPSINTGVIAFKKSEQWKSFAETWIQLAKIGVEIKSYIPEEVAFSVLYPSIDRWGLKIGIMSGNYNIYVLDDAVYENPTVYHFCGNKHCISDIQNCKIWKDTFEGMRKSNISNINSFLPYADKRLKEYLSGNVVLYKKDKPNVKVDDSKRDVIGDRRDDSAFRHPRDRHHGYTTEKEYHQIVPHFFTNDRAFLALEGLYKGRSAFLICNGPSFATLDHKRLNLPGIMTFGVNNGAKTFRPNFWTSVDDPARFLKSIWLDPKIMKFVPQSHFDKLIFDNEKWEMVNTYVRDCPNVVGYMRNDVFNAESFLVESSINWGNSAEKGGGRSVMLPALKILHLLGFRKVYLLGCDMKMSETYTYHFDEQRSKGAVKCNMNTYDHLKEEYLPRLKPVFEAEKFEVYNCNPESELKVFPFVSFEEAISEAMLNLGDVENERTWGMYSKPEEKKKWKEEPDKSQKAHLTNIFTPMAKTMNKPSPIIVPKPPQQVRAPIIPMAPKMDKPKTVPSTPILNPIPSMPSMPKVITPNPIPKLPIRQVVGKVSPWQTVQLPQKPLENQATLIPKNSNAISVPPKIAKNIPRGAISDDSSKLSKPPVDNIPPSNKNITIEDNGL